MACGHYRAGVTRECKKVKLSLICYCNGILSFVSLRYGSIGHQIPKAKANICVTSSSVCIGVASDDLVVTPLRKLTEITRVSIISTLTFDFINDLYGLCGSQSRPWEE